MHNLSPRSTSTAGVAQWLERHVANVNVVGSNPITRFVASPNGIIRPALAGSLPLAKAAATIELVGGCQELLGRGLAG